MVTNGSALADQPLPAMCYLDERCYLRDTAPDRALNAGDSRGAILAATTSLPYYAESDCGHERQSKRLKVPPRRRSN